MSEARYPFVRLEVGEALAEEAGAALFELGALGIEQRDASTLIGASGERVVLLGSFDTDERARAAAAALPASWLPTVGEIVGDAWRDAWKAHFEPFVLCRGGPHCVVVRPPWREHEPLPGETVIVLEPGRAFGTGLHETTRLVAELLAERTESLRGAVVLDVGCGSGILALVAMALGAEAARGIDIDREAVAVTCENAERNGCADRLHADDTRVEALTSQYSTVLANIEATPLIAMAQALTERVSPGGRIVLSGILAPCASATQWEQVRGAYGHLEVEEVRVQGEWLAAVLRA
jgi:ribosomal protein L11 methyltransferase